MSIMENNLIRDSSVALKAFNNPNCSDVVFLVNETKYYAYRKFVGGASTFFQTLLEGEFKESSQKEISLNNVMTYDDNFLIILKFIHGFEINLKEFCNLQVCELLHLTEYFDLASLGDKVQNYLTKLEFCDLEFDSVAVLVNLAIKKSYDGLYKVAEKFIFANTEHFLANPSFLELDYNSLKALLKSDSFYADEFKIFMAVLEWYDANSADMTSSDTGSDAFDVVAGVKDETKESTSEDEGVGKSSPTTTTIEDPGTEPTKLTALMKEVRNPKVDLFDLYKVLKNKDKANIIHKYQTELSDTCSSANEIKHLPRVYLPVFFDVTINDIERIENGSMKSDVYLIKNMKWKLKVKWSKQTGGVSVFLKCASAQENWQCDAMCHVRLVQTTGVDSTNYCLMYPKYSFFPDSDEICKVPLITLAEVITTQRVHYMYPDGSLKIRVTIHPEDPIFK